MCRLRRRTRHATLSPGGPLWRRSSQAEGVVARPGAAAHGSDEERARSGSGPPDALGAPGRARTQTSSISPRRTAVSIDGAGPPDAPAFARSIRAIYSAAYGLKFAQKKAGRRRSRSARKGVGGPRALLPISSRRLSDCDPAAAVLCVDDAARVASADPSWVLCAGAIGGCRPRPRRSRSRLHAAATGPVAFGFLRAGGHGLAGHALDE